ncbi:carboxymuconolactone decarboxylase family protein [Variovorax guangxiensis]|jgi:alkylhydroperoxidase/carboxymuconolactone decarboxylase family protein YurZ|uniref:carboxymuconolactone decarboxylase family protein n=1 Tax=Variovorax guangxiensis TaxID=1775474 RepID=UPI002858D70C|nr:carboxymuconolactone decarboxylase family protein [Variovorax guangxiensis]MDR6858776.1 alkylhydroperoxidase/carboxymuconolactone decarboxylase family protein YurZ [Variovorax guangxiensis]
MKASTLRVAEVNAPAVARYKEMRDLLIEQPGLDRSLCEILVTTQLALLGQEVAFKLHAQRLFDLGVSKEQLERLVLVGLGVTFVIPQAAKALNWIAEAHALHQGSEAQA